MKKHIIFLSLAALGFMGITSCTDELDIAKMGNMGAEEDFYQTDDDAEQAIAACYKQYADNWALITHCGDIMSDDVWCAGNSRSDDASFENMGAFTHSSTTSKIENLFKGLYAQIYRANLVIDKFENVDTDVKKRDKAEAYFFRGMAHFYLGAFFGTAPIVDHLLTTDEYNQPNSTRAGLYEQAISDLTQAANDLKVKSAMGDNNTRITKEAASALLGKVYLFLGDTNKNANGEYSKAVSALKVCAESTSYKLYEGNIGDLGHAMCDYNDEYVLEVNRTPDMSNLFSLYSEAYVYYAWRQQLIDATDQKADYAALCAGWGFMNPTSDIYNAFVKEEGVDGYRLNQSIITTAQMEENLGLKPVKGLVIHGNEGYWTWKRRGCAEDYVMLLGLPHANFVYMRLAEVYLLLAEAAVKTNDEGTATTYLNKVRQRAKLEPKSATLDAIKLERRLELFQEGQRWFDLVRWGDAANVLKDHGKVMYAWDVDAKKAIIEYQDPSSQGFIAGKHEVLPIPDTEVLMNDNLEQNPGYGSDK
jgi:hypothetical protein